MRRALLLLALVLAPIGEAAARHAEDAAAPCAPQRSRAVRRAFQRAHPCPATGKTSGPCPGYVVDHAVPLACGGADALHNLQWLTVAAAREKDRAALARCRPRRAP